MASSSGSASRPPPAATTVVRPPEWQPPYHKNADLGYPDFHPPRPGQEEDSMAEAYVKHGYSAKPIVQTDSFTVHEMIHDTWEKQDQSVLRQLGELMSAVSIRREKALPTVGPSTFRIPDRRTMPAQKTQAWIADLANPDVPLTRLNKFIPHGPKGADMLDMLETNKVPTSRAIWYIRVVGAADTQNMSRGRSAFNPAQYSIDWANVVTTYLKKHLSEITLPRVQMGASSSIRSTFKSVLSEPESRDRWVGKFNYTLALLRVFYAEGLVDHATFLFWLAQQVGASIIPQLGFVVKIAEEYLDGLLEHRGFLRPFINGLVEKLVEVARIPQTERSVVAGLSLTLGSLLQQTFTACPDAFVYPRIWRDHTNQRLMHHLMVKGPHEIVRAPPENPQARRVYQYMQEAYEGVERRNNALLFNQLPIRNSFAMRVAMADIQLLNSIGPDTDLHAVSYFDASQELANAPTPAFDSKLNVLLTWSVARSQYGDHRPYAAVSLISIWRDEAKLKAIRRKAPKPDGPLQEALFRWLAASDPKHLAGISLLFGELCRRQLFSYAWYIQRLMARGELEHISDGSPRPHLVEILSNLPIPSTSLVSERRVALHGVGGHHRSSEPFDRKIKQEIRTALPELFSGSSEENVIPDISFPILRAASPYEQHYVVVHWLLPTVQNHLKTSTGHRLPNGSFSVLMEIMRVVKAYPSILDLNLRLLQDTTSDRELRQLLDTISRYPDVWASMDALGNIGENLFAASRRLQVLGIGTRSILAVLLRSEYLQHVSEETRQLLLSEEEAMSQMPQAASQVPPIIQEILDLPNGEDPKHLVERLWSQFGGNPALGLVIWDNAVQGVRQADSLPPEERSQHVQLYSTFIQEFQRLLPLNNTLDHQINQWFRTGNGREEFSEFDANTWKTLIPFLLDLVLNDCLTTAMLLENIAYVAWKQAATLDKEMDQTETFLRAANVLTERLLLMDYPGPTAFVEDVLAPLDLIQVQHFQTQRQRVYGGTGVKALFKATRHLVYLEVNSHIPEELRNASTEMRRSLCQHPQFRTTAFRHLTELKEMFLRPLVTEKDVRLGDALRTIIHVGEPSARDTEAEPVAEWLAMFSQLNAWGFSRASIELRLTLERMGSGLDSDEADGKAKAEKDIQYFMTGLFSRSLQPEETDLTVDVLKGIEGAVATQFLNHGLRRLTSLIDHLNTTMLDIRAVSSFYDTGGEVLRLLASIAVPHRSSEDFSPEKPPYVIDADVIEPYMKSILKAYETVDKIVNATLPKAEEQGVDPSILREDTVFLELSILLARLLQFVLRFDEVWTAKVKSMAEDLVAITINLTVAFGGGCVYRPLVFKVFVDTASYLIDEIPKEPKNPIVDLIRTVPGVHPDRLPVHMPLDLRKMLRPLLQYVSKDRYTQNLVHLIPHAEQASTPGSDTDGRYQLGPPVQSKAWEWLEHIEDATTAAATADDGETYRNDTSVSLEYFMAHPTGERLVKHDPDEEDRYIEDHTHRESIYERDWKETRIAPNGFDDPESSESEDDPSTVAGGRKNPHAAGSDDARSLVSGSAASPALTRASSSSRRTGTVEREIIDVDALPGPEESTGRGRKRKASLNTARSTIPEEAEPDDEVEIIETSNSGAARGGKRGRGRPQGSVGRGRGKKKP